MRQQYLRMLAVFVAVLPFAVVALMAALVPESREVPPVEPRNELVQGQPTPTAVLVEAAQKPTWPAVLPAGAADLAGSVGAITGRPGVAPRSQPLEEDAGLQGRIEAYLSGQTGTYGVAIADLTTNRVAYVNPGRTFSAASTYKLLVMYRVHQLLAEGQLSLGEPIEIDGSPSTVGEALNQMITVSSNEAAFALVDRIGGWGSVVAAAQEVGMAGTYADGELFWTTPADMLAFFDALAGGRLVSAEMSNRMIDLLAAQGINDRLPAGLPGGVAVAHKTGELPGVRNDVGIVFTPSGRYVICVLGEGDEVEATNVIAGISSLAWEELGGGATQ